MSVYIQKKLAECCLRLTHHTTDLGFRVSENPNIPIRVRFRVGRRGNVRANRECHSSPLRGFRGRRPKADHDSGIRVRFRVLTILEILPTLSCQFASGRRE